MVVSFTFFTATIKLKRSRKVMCRNCRLIIRFSIHIFINPWDLFAWFTNRKGSVDWNNPISTIWRWHSGGHHVVTNLWWFHLHMAVTFLNESRRHDANSKGGHGNVTWWPNLWRHHVPMQRSCADRVNW